MRAIPALRDIDLVVRRGEFVGIVGRNGSGKSTLLKIIMGAIQPDPGGTVMVKGRILRLALGMGFDAELSARDNIYHNASLMGLSFRVIGQKFEEIVEFAELQTFVDTKLKFYSSGMRSRLAFAIAVHVEADILLIDEFFGGVGDIRFQEKSAQVFRQSILQGKTVLYVSHQLAVLKEHCNRVLMMDQGRIVMQGTAPAVLDRYVQEGGR
jgi:ABC-2 type transport system ATP-binding protein